MDFAKYAIKNKVVSWMFTLILLIGGSVSFLQLGQLEFPEFTIKTALVITKYPGASPEQVEEEVTLAIEDAIQKLPNIKNITSINSAGLSQIQVEIKEHVPSDKLPQLWDELRRKINDLKPYLPPGVQSPQVIDDFGDVYGMLFNISGADYSMRELQNYANELRRELILVKGVKKVNLSGLRQQQVVVEISQQKLAALGLNQDYIYGQISNQNGVSNAGSVLVANNRIRINPTGEFASVAQMEQLLISPPGSAKVIRLGDIAKVYKSETDSPSVIYHSDQATAISLGVAFSSGVNVVEVGALIRTKLQQLEAERPIGIELITLYDQSAQVEQTVSGFLINLAQSIAIVVAVLLIFMGVRSGILMGAVLLLTILGTFIVMQVLAIELQIISLGALIIALGMLVDNAIVVTEGILIGLKRGQTKLQTATKVIQQTRMPLLGATVIAIIAFAPIGLSDTATGEFCASLFYVLLISLFISWITAMTLTPFYVDLMFKDGDSEDNDSDPYQGAIFTAYKALLNFSLKHRIVVIILMVFILVASIFGFSKVKNVFFPASNTPIFFVDVWLPEGTDILHTEKVLLDIEQRIQHLQQQNDIGIENVTAVIGQGAQRFVLPYFPEKSYSAYGQLIIKMKNLPMLKEQILALQKTIPNFYPEAKFRFKYMENGPSPAAKIEARFYGEDPEVLRQLAAQAKNVFEQEQNAAGVRHNWRNKVMVIRPEIAQAQARETGISKRDIDNALLLNFTGKVVGVYREHSHLMPIVARAPESERLDASSIAKIQVWSENNVYVPLTQVVSNFNSEWENPLIMRRDRKRMIAVYADPLNGSGETADSVFKRLKPKIEAIVLPDGYTLEWGGEYETASQAQQSVFSSIPLGYLAMFLITVLLFNSVRQPLVIWFTVPLSVIGVVSGLLLFDAPFSFMALLGLLSLTGMIIKNGIVLVEQINIELDLGKAPLAAVVDSAVSRVRPVAMAAITTMLGMLPLLTDAFFGSMAITIIFGLGFASVLTLIILPVMYTLVYRIKI
ncbi:efflux RND transporter permease subunit [Paraferrimonas sp. SM1919]|uniref:efflux RND transporter permease subunit n=1 Tax=Paraferrimonas sp. SM1919 TaxID=2662263 RepID=UPI0013D313B6|nr:efflux RND transporter permease subunit [Paraferrimonas sp. SM1919]